MEEVILNRLVKALVLAWPKDRGRNTEICRRTGYSPGQVSGVLNKKVTLDSKFIKSVCREFSINEGWVVAGEGEMFLRTDRFDICAEPPTPFGPETGGPPKRASHVYAESLLAQLTDNDMDEVIADMLERIRKSKARKNEVFAGLTPAGRQELIEEFTERIRRLEAQEAGISLHQEGTAAAGP